MLSDPRVRLVARALLAGVITTVTLMQDADDPFSAAAWKSALVVGFWTVVELITPLNALVGWWKKPAPPAEG